VSFNDKCFEWLCTTHQVKKVGRYYHYPCSCCVEDLGRSGYYHKETNTIKCYQSSCDYSSSWSSVLEYIQFCENISYSEVGKVINGFTPTVGRVIDEEVIKRPKHCKLPKEFIPLDQGEGKLSEEAREYMRGRGFNIKELVRDYGIGYSKTSGKYFRRIIFPFKDDTGKLVYYQARDATNRSDYRWINPKEHEVPLGKSDVLYNEWNCCVLTGDVFVCEGIADDLTMIEATALQGKTLSINQLKKLCGFNCSAYYMLFDEGAWRDSIHAAYTLYQAAGKKVYAVNMDKGDANEMGRDYVLSRDMIEINERTYYDELSRVEKREEKTYRGVVGGAISMW